MTQEATSAPDSGQLPSEVEAAIDDFNDAVIDFWNEDSSRELFHAARAELTAQLLRWGEERYQAGVSDEAEGQAYDAQAD